MVFADFKELSYHLTGGTDKKYYTVTNAYLQIQMKTHTLKKTAEGFLLIPWFSEGEADMVRFL